ncbi:hypothetical protein GCM10007047_34340 [Cerasicoccus arenae]|uniref:Glycosyltransferase RgtA/B/C/D-like domain-containing protein n=1 Tax=Cerasicoccus arenae TaxID=424488 RepID=A0A8J3GEF8_9BACT|nr:hypothetical protein GCM10007047_34340 [Cerasicoccus arenae]
MALAYGLGGGGAALLAGVLLALFPRYWGHQFINPKDIPFAATYVWGLWALVRILRNDRRDWRSMLLFGGLAGACMSVRVGGLLLLCYAGLFFGVQLAINWAQSGVTVFRREVVRLVRWLPLATALAFLILFVFWPAAHQNPFATTAGAISEVSQFGWQGDVLFGGEVYRANELPRRYLPEMLARVTPDWWLLLIISSLAYLVVGAMKRPGWQTLWTDHRDKLLVAFAVIFPPAYIIIRGSIVYDGMRHVLFIIPPAAALLAALSCGAFRMIWARFGRSVALAWAVPAALLAVLTTMDMVRLHPYEYTYYNRLSGGLAGAAGRFETDYWGTAFREATEILAEQLPPRERPWRITMEPPLDLLFERYGKPVIPPPALVEPFLGENIVLVRSHEHPDFYIASTRNGYNEMRGGESLLAVQRDGVTLVEVKVFQQE